MFQRILVAIDDSRMAEGAIREALDIAKAHAAEVRIVHAIESPYAYPETWYAEVHADLEALRRIWRQAGQRVLDRAAALARQAGVAVGTALLEADSQRLNRLIVDDAVRWRADLVVVGTHGHRGVEHLLLGSVAEAVARTAPSSVLLIRGREAGPTG